MSNEQQMNSLDRFRKDPGRLVLEEHGNCEVPAGCGGVVLRWRMPRAALSIVFWCYHPGEGTWWLHGNSLPTSRVDLLPGQHVLGCSLSGVDLSKGVLLFAAVAEPPASARTQTDRTTPPIFKVVSGADDTWRFSLDPPRDWLLSSFDATAWPALVAVDAPTFTRNEPGMFMSQRCIRMGASCLGLSAEHAAQSGPARNSIRIRKVLEVPDLGQAGTST
jgi:hypothetical protein